MTVPRTAKSPSALKAAEPSDAKGKAAQYEGVLETFLQRGLEAKVKEVAAPAGADKATFVPVPIANRDRGLNVATVGGTEYVVRRSPLTGDQWFRGSDVRAAVEASGGVIQLSPEEKAFRKYSDQVQSHIAEYVSKAASTGQSRVDGLVKDRKLMGQLNRAPVAFEIHEEAFHGKAAILDGQLYFNLMESEVPLDHGWYPAGAA